jgi:hypothetical protein
LRRKNNKEGKIAIEYTKLVDKIVFKISKLICVGKTRRKEGEIAIEYIEEIE